MIHVEGLEKRYGEVTALAGVSFDVPAGQVVAFLGPNGAGKSTTMKILTGFLVPDAGSCAVAGRPVDPSDAAGRAAVGYLPEATPLYAGMRVDRYLGFVAELHGLGGAAKRDAVGRVIEACHLGAHAGRRIAWLSKGYRQRVGLAQALVGDPSVLILDEPTSGLDPREVVRMRELIRELGAEKTVLLSTHVLGEAEAVCDRALVIAAGRLVADGTPRELARHRAGRVALALRVPAYDTTVIRPSGPSAWPRTSAGCPVSAPASRSSPCRAASSGSSSRSCARPVPTPAASPRAPSAAAPSRPSSCWPPPSTSAAGSFPSCPGWATISRRPSSS